MLTVKRPGGGIPAKEIEKVINKRAKNFIKKDSLIINTHTIEVKEQTETEKIKRDIFNKLVIILTFIVVIMALYLFRNVIK